MRESKGSEGPKEAQKISREGVEAPPAPYFVICLWDDKRLMTKSYTKKS